MPLSSAPSRRPLVRPFVTTFAAVVLSAGSVGAAIAAPPTDVPRPPHADGAQPGAQGNKPADPGKPAEAGKPASPGNSANTPANPGNANPSKPADPGKPAEAGKPASPGNSANTPATPGKPADAGKPASPGNSASTPAAGASADRTGSVNGTGRAGSPPGNNGTVKIAPLGEMDQIPNNTPHPGCSFQVEWYGFDEGADVISTVSFAMHAPTRDVGLSVDGPRQVFVGGSPGRGAGNDGLDAVATYRLSFDGAPHPKQGYHVKLTVSTPRSNGNDTKTKVFWVAPCTDPVPTPVDEDAPVERPTPGPLAVGGGGVQDWSSDPQLDGGVEGEIREAAGSGDAPVETSASIPSRIAAGIGGVWTNAPWAPLGTMILGAGLVAGAVLLRRRARGPVGD